MKNKVKENAIHLAIGMVFLLIMVGGVLSYYNRYSMNNALLKKAQSEAVLREIDLIHDNIRFMDISARGYALIRKREFLFWDLKSAQRQNYETFRRLDSLFEIQGYQSGKYIAMKKAMVHYVSVFGTMVKHLENEAMNEYLSMLEHDYGKAFYQAYTPLLDEIIQQQNRLATDGQREYESAVSRNRFVQVLLAVLGLPTLLWIYFRINRDDRERQKLLQNLEQNNRRYLFDTGKAIQKDAKQILETSIDNLKQAAKFVTEISSGNYGVAWNGIDANNAKLNVDNLAGKLVFMRDEMKRIKEEEGKRMWTTQGLSDVSEIIRKHQGNVADLCWHSLTFLVKYAGAQQGSLFLVSKNEQGEGTELELMACYAFDRKKYIEKRMNPGQGLIGEAYLSGDTILLKEVPGNYINITSGLGDATPTCIVIVPMKHNDEVLAVVEIASFRTFEPHQVSFLEKGGDFIASAIANVAQNERNHRMMQQLIYQTEQLRAQEEELRQNIEELEATQEVMRRQSMGV